MKKIYLALFALASILITSCSNEEIEITSKGKLCDLTCQINVKAPYDEFGISGDVTDLFLRDKSGAIGIDLFLYNEDGELCEWGHKYQYQYSLNNTTIEFEDIVEGQYTLVAVEKLVFPGDSKSEAFSISDENNLSTLEIVQNRDYVRFSEMVAVHCSSVFVSADKKLEVTPKAKGSIVDFYCYNYDKSSYTTVGFGTQDIISSYKLDPKLSREDRFYTDVTDNDHFILRGSTDNLESGYAFSSYILESSIVCQFARQDESLAQENMWLLREHGTFSVEDGKTYFAGIYYFGNQSESTYLGSYDGLNDWLSSCEKNEEYNRENSVVPEVYMTWGGTVKDTQGFMSSYNLFFGSSGKAEALDDGSFGLGYEGKGLENEIDYRFTSETTGLYEVDIYYSAEDVSITDLKNELDDDYMKFSYDEESDARLYFSEDMKTLVLLANYGDVYGIGFFDYDYLYGSDASTRALQMKQKTRLASSKAKGQKVKRNQAQTPEPSLLMRGRKLFQYIAK